MSAQNFRFKCRKCGYEGLRRYNVEEFDRLQYGGDQKGISCFTCGFPKMVVMRSMKQVRDGFVPGFQRSIRKHCATYGEYKTHLKRMGLVELGYEDIEFDGEDKKIDYWDDSILKKVADMGVYISGREADALKQGKIDSI